MVTRPFDAFVSDPLVRIIDVRWGDFGASYFIAFEIVGTVESLGTVFGTTTKLDTIPHTPQFTTSFVLERRTPTITEGYSPIGGEPQIVDGSLSLGSMTTGVVSALFEAADIAQSGQGAGMASTAWEGVTLSGTPEFFGSEIGDPLGLLSLEIVGSAPVGTLSVSWPDFQLRRDEDGVVLGMVGFDVAFGLFSGPGPGQNFAIFLSFGFTPEA